MRKLDILVTNDDGIDSNGLHVLTEILRPYGNLTVIAPAYPQSGMAASVSLGKDIFYKQTHSEQGLLVGKVTGSPVTCVKFALMHMFRDRQPDFIVSGINHGANTSASVIYSGTLGATMEGALRGIPSIGVSIESHRQDVDLSAVRMMFPGIFENAIANPIPEGIFLNVNFPAIPYQDIKGTVIASQGSGVWIKEFVPKSLEECSIPAPEEGMSAFNMVGEYVDAEFNKPTADHKLMEKGYVTIVPHNIDFTDYKEMERMKQNWKF